MGTARSLLFTISSIMMILSGAGSIVCGVFMTIKSLDSTDTSMPLTFITTVLILIFSVTNIVTGIHGVRNHNRRINSAVVIRLPEISVIVALLTVVITLFNGVQLGTLLVLIVTGILIPIAFIYAAARKSYL